jgi:type IV fimbrial biogenesis protein FimT
MVKGNSHSAAVSPAGGMTLVELLVVLGVAAILAVVAVPAMQSLLTANQLTTVTDALATALSEARSEAAKLNVSVQLTPTNGGVDWTGGWTMVAAAPVTANMPSTLRNGAATPVGFLLNSSSSLPPPVIFDPTGRLASGGPLEFVVCQGGGPPSGKSRMIIVAPYGGVRIAQTDSSSGNPIGADGTAFGGCSPP